MIRYDAVVLIVMARTELKQDPQSPGNIALNVKWCPTVFGAGPARRAA